MNETFARTELLIGEDGLETLRKASVAVFGIGGVGGHVAEVLARSGVGELTYVDNDTVAPSNLNCQIVALHSTLWPPILIHRHGIASRPILCRTRRGCAYTYSTPVACF